jgi:enoyl-CoA hydratase/carnithine racemase
MIESLKKFLNITPEDLKKPVFTKSKGDVFYLILNTKANTFTKPFVRQIHAELDIIEANDGPTAMVTVSFSKMFSGGLDLKYISNL